MRFEYGPLTVFVERAGVARPRGSPPLAKYRVEVGLPEVGVWEFKWVGFPISMVAGKGGDERDVSEAVIETLYMALTPDDFWRDARTGKHALERSRWIDAARVIGFEALREAFEPFAPEGEEVTERGARRRHRQERARQMELGPRHWFPEEP